MGNAMLADGGRLEDRSGPFSVWAVVGVGVAEGPREWLLT